MGCFSGLIDDLKGRLDAAQGVRLSEVKTIYLGNADKVTTDRGPWLHLLYDDPAITEVQVSMNRGVSGTHHLLLEGMTVGSRDDVEKVYQAPLLLLEKVLDEIGSWNLHQGGLHVQSWTTTIEGVDSGPGPCGFLIKLDIVQKYRDQERSA